MGFLFVLRCFCFAGLFSGFLVAGSWGIGDGVNAGLQAKNMICEVKNLMCSVLLCASE